MVKDAPPGPTTLSVWVSDGDGGTLSDESSSVKFDVSKMQGVAWHLEVELLIAVTVLVKAIPPCTITWKGVQRHRCNTEQVIIDQHLTRTVASGSATLISTTGSNP